MSRVSVLIPSRNERFLTQTIRDVLDKAAGDIEVVVALDGYDTPLVDDPRVKVVKHRDAEGMRASINDAASLATGDFLLKCDAHCMFSEGYDKVLARDCDETWVVVPRRFSLDAERWAIDENGKPPRDYHYLCFPAKGKPHDEGMHGVEWWGRGKERRAPEYDIDDNMSAQGSAWFMPRKHWLRLGGMSEHGYGKFAQEFQEIGLKTWLGGGAVKVNKKVWYAHLHKGSRYGRGYSTAGMGMSESHLWSARHWMNDLEPNMLHSIDWLVERFWPVPTWEENWREIWEQGEQSLSYYS